VNHYNVWQLGLVIEFLTDATCLAGAQTIRGDNAVPLERIEKFYLPTIKYAQQQFTSIELGAALHRCDLFLIAMRNGLVWSELGNQAQALSDAIKGELQFRRFAYVPTEKAQLHDKYRHTWNAVLTAFPETEPDVRDAIDAYALGLNTACVFHLMRVAEKGLRRLAAKVKVKLTHKGKPVALQFSDWNKVITGISNIIVAARTKPHGPKRQAQLQFHSDAADHCLYMKEIWRNEVSHTGREYNGSEALGVINRVRDFMELLVKNL
jgi:hypothetical protein